MEGVIIGAAGGASAGIILAVIKWLSDQYLVKRDAGRVLCWLKKACSSEGSDLWRSTHAIASYNNLTLERVQYICSYSEKIVRSSKEKEMWGLADMTRGKSTMDVS